MAPKKNVQVTHVAETTTVIGVFWPEHVAKRHGLLTADLEKTQVTVNGQTGTGYIAPANVAWAPVGTTTVTSTEVKKPAE